MLLLKVCKLTLLFASTFNNSSSKVRLRLGNRVCPCILCSTTEIIWKVARVFASEQRNIALSCPPFPLHISSMPPL